MHTIYFMQAATFLSLSWKSSVSQARISWLSWSTSSTYRNM